MIMIIFNDIKLKSLKAFKTNMMITQYNMSVFCVSPDYFKDFRANAFKMFFSWNLHIFPNFNWQTSLEYGCEVCEEIRKLNYFISW